MLIDSTQVAYGKAAHFFLFPFFLVRRCAGPYQETQFIAVSVGKRGCHSHWLTALRFARCSVGICFKLLCFSFFLFFFPHTVEDYTKDMYTVHTKTKQRDQPHSPVSEPFCFGPILIDRRWSPVRPGDGPGRVQFCGCLCYWVIVLLFRGGLNKENKLLN